MHLLLWRYFVSEGSVQSEQYGECCWISACELVAEWCFTSDDSVYLP